MKFYLILLMVWGSECVNVVNGMRKRNRSMQRAVTDFVSEWFPHGGIPNYDVIPTQSGVPGRVFPNLYHASPNQKFLVFNLAFDSISVSLRWKQGLPSSMAWSIKNYYSVNWCRKAEQRQVRNNTGACNFVWGLGVLTSLGNCFYSLCSLCFIISVS